VAAALREGDPDDLHRAHGPGERLPAERLRTSVATATG